MKRIGSKSSEYLKFVAEEAGIIEITGNEKALLDVVLNSIQGILIKKAYNSLQSFIEIIDFYADYLSEKQLAISEPVLIEALVSEKVFSQTKKLLLKIFLKVGYLSLHVIKALVDGCQLSEGAQVKAHELFNMYFANDQTELVKMLPELLSKTRAYVDVNAAFVLNCVGFKHMFACIKEFSLIENRERTLCRYVSTYYSRIFNPNADYKFFSDTLNEVTCILYERELSVHSIHVTQIAFLLNQVLVFNNLETIDTSQNTEFVKRVMHDKDFLSRYHDNIRAMLGHLYDQNAIRDLLSFISRKYKEDSDIRYRQYLKKLLVNLVDKDNILELMEVDVLSKYTDVLCVLQYTDIAVFMALYERFYANEPNCVISLIPAFAYCCIDKNDMFNNFLGIVGDLIDTVKSTDSIIHVVRGVDILIRTHLIGSTQFNYPRTGAAYSSIERMRIYLRDTDIVHKIVPLLSVVDNSAIRQCIQTIYTFYGLGAPLDIVHSILQYRVLPVNDVLVAIRMALIFRVHLFNDNESLNAIRCLVEITSECNLPVTHRVGAYNLLEAISSDKLLSSCICVYFTEVSGVEEKVCRHRLRLMTSLYLNCSHCRPDDRVFMFENMLIIAHSMLKANSSVRTIGLIRNCLQEFINNENVYLLLQFVLKDIRSIKSIEFLSSIKIVTILFEFIPDPVISTFERYNFSELFLILSKMSNKGKMVCKLLLRAYMLMFKHFRVCINDEICSNILKTTVLFGRNYKKHCLAELKDLINFLIQNEPKLVPHELLKVARIHYARNSPISCHVTKKGKIVLKVAENRSQHN